jgi:hypothetical protein
MPVNKARNGRLPLEIRFEQERKAVNQTDDPSEKMSWPNFRSPTRSGL